jgi:two-component system, cell cycle sensor histidine kinase and response regulator CckA
MSEEATALRARIAELEAAMEGHQALASKVSASEALIQRILEAVPGGIVHVSHNGALLRANDTAQKFLGLSWDELKSSFTSDFSGATTHEDGSPCAVEDYPVSRCLMTGEAQGPTTLAVEQTNGETRWGIFTAIPLELPEGRGAVVTFMDITDRKAAEEERQVLLMRMRQSERLASLGTLAASVAHEINNPLTYVMANLEPISDALPITETLAHTQLDDVHMGTRRIRRIVRNLSRFTHIEEAAEDAEPTALQPALDQAIAMVAGRMRHHARLEQRSDATLPVLAVEGYLVQVFVNLLVNALDAIPEGDARGQSIRIRTRDDGDRVHITVSDTGGGIPAEILARVLDPFFSTKSIGSGSASGTGLGLSISRQLLHTMGGDLRISSEVGEGTSVEVTLLAALDGADRAAAKATAPAGAAVGDPVGKDEAPADVNVLVVDDEPEVGRAIRQLLTGFHVTLAASGEEALELSEAHVYDAIVCDLMMPNVSGIEVYRHLLAHQPRLAERLVFLTGGACSPSTTAFLADCPRPVFAKPVRVAKLRAALHAIANPQAAG